MDPVAKSELFTVPRTEINVRNHLPSNQIIQFYHNMLFKNKNNGGIINNINVATSSEEIFK